MKKLVTLIMPAFLLLLNMTFACTIISCPKKAETPAAFSVDNYGSGRYDKGRINPPINGRCGVVCFDPTDGQARTVINEPRSYDGFAAQYSVHSSKYRVTLPYPGDLYIDVLPNFKTAKNAFGFMRTHNYVLDSQVLPANNDRKALERTSEAIRSAFARGDVQAILSYHHPDIVKALTYTKYIRGLQALKTDLTNTLASTSLNFKKNEVESLLIEGNTAVEIAAFTIEGLPKNGGKAFEIKGRAMVVYVRYKQSPTGWASICEIVQPATE